MLAVSLIVVAVLGLIGLGVGPKLKSTSLRVPGTESAHGEELLQRYFGDSAPFAILLEGPPAAIETQGPRLVAFLHRHSSAVTLSPWDRGPDLNELRPRPGAALILADFRVSADRAIKQTSPALEQILAAHLKPPVRARLGGFASVARAIEDESIDSTRRGELIVAPILLLILLLVFRSPIAAAIPLVFGITTVGAAQGLIAIAAGYVDISGLALSIASMIGLALGVDYALLIVSRFREELHGGADPATAAATTRMTAGRTTVFAGSSLLVSVLVAVFLVPGALLASLCATVVAVIVLAVGGPWIVAPALLTLVGRNIDRWSLTRFSFGSRLLATGRGAVRHPRAAAAVSALPLVLLAAPALALGTASLTIDQLPSHNRAREDVERIEATVGGGWISPDVVVASSPDGPVTAPRQLREIGAWQHRVARDPEVDAVIGPAFLAKRVDPLRRQGKELLADDGSGSNKLSSSLGRAGDAISRLRRGLGLASEGAQELSVGSGRAAWGASLISRGLDFAHAGGASANRSLERFRRGAHQLADGERGAKLGSRLLGFSVSELRSLSRAAMPAAARLQGRLRPASGVAERAAGVTVEELRAAWQELNAMGVGRSDPHFAALGEALRRALAAASGEDPVDGAAFAEGYEGLPAALAAERQVLRQAAAEAERLHGNLAAMSESIATLQRLTRRISAGLARLASGGERLSSGSDRIVGGAQRVTSGLARLADASSRLTDGLERLHGGNDALGAGLASAFHRTLPLATGVNRANDRLASGRERLSRSSPGFFDSGYFLLSALDGARPAGRQAASQIVDLERGGGATRMLVVARNGVNGAGSQALYQRLRRDNAALARSTGMQVAVSGGVAQTTDYAKATSSRLPPLVLVITLITFLAMLTILRALPLAAIAVTLNLLAVAAGFGALAILGVLPEGSPLGGVDGVDPVSAAGIFGVVFGISIDYAVFLLVRMRESMERHGDHRRAITDGLDRTSSVIVGAAAIMLVVFMVFVTAPIVTIAQFGIGLAVAVLLDATLIRLVLLPSLMTLIGPRVWWLPRWLDAVLPRLDVHGGSAAADPEPQPEH